MVRRRDVGFRLATFWTALSLISSISIMVSPPGTPPDGRYCHSSGCLLGSPCCPVISAARGLGNQCRSCSRNARITSWFSPTCRSFPRSLICPYVLLIVVSRLFCHCSCLHVTLLSLPVSLLPCAAGLIAWRSSSSCGPQTLLAGAGISSSKQDLHIVYVILRFFFGENKVSPSSTLCIWFLHHPPPWHNICCLVMVNHLCFEINISVTWWAPFSALSTRMHPSDIGHLTSNDYNKTPECIVWESVHNANTLLSLWSLRLLFVLSHSIMHS